MLKLSEKDKRYLAFRERYQPIFELLLEELIKAEGKHRHWPVDPIHAYSVLGEECGELNKEVLQMMYEPHKTSLKEIEKEAIQTGAMAMRFLINLDRYDFSKKSEQFTSYDGE